MIVERSLGCYIVVGGQGTIVMSPPATDEELHDWLRWAEENGTSFPRKLAEAAFWADLKEYALLRPVLLGLKETHAKE
jgi:hypothetical protein